MFETGDTITDSDMFYLHLWRVIGWAELDDVQISEWPDETSVFTETFEEFSSFETTNGSVQNGWKVHQYSGNAPYCLKDSETA